MSNDQAKLNSMVISTLLDIVNNLKEGRECAVEFEMKNNVVRTMEDYGRKEVLHHDGRTFKLELK